MGCYNVAVWRELTSRPTGLSRMHFEHPFKKKIHLKQDILWFITLELYYICFKPEALSNACISKNFNVQAVGW